MSTLKIEDIPDYAALQQIERALWKQGKTRGAAILVGAGFSLNAQLVHDGAVAPPLWSELAAAMQARIYPEGAPSQDPLRLAEEFKAVLGQPALEGMIRELVPDEEWMPGPLHKQLVRLPWVDILTTNWDTLIERAAATTFGQTYETVRCLSDIATTRAPRVVKLHGSLPSNTPFIVSEEDYRTYPRIFAPFVNLVQQVLLENELCLLGFSGDDPNFLSWSGWVRDQLGASARRIHLVGVLKLSAARRRMLEARNISAVDLFPLVSDIASGRERHQRASEMFLEYLSSAQPKAQWEWPSDPDRSIAWQDSADQEKQIEVVLGLTESWAAQRKAYPGWAVCHPDTRLTLRNNAASALLRPAILDRLPVQNRGQIIFELAWRLDKALLPLPEWLKDTFHKFAQDKALWADKTHHDFVLLFLLRAAREQKDALSFERWAALLGQRANDVPELSSEVKYELCLQARDALDFTRLKEMIEPFRGVDPLWRVRHAALLCEIGEIKTARPVIQQALGEIRDHFYRNRDSLWVLSRLAWIQFVARSFHDWHVSKQEDVADEADILGLRFHQTKCDPWDTIIGIERQIEEDLRKVNENKKTTEVRFDAGTYRDHSTRMTFGTWQSGASIYELGRIADIIGIPLRVESTVILNTRMERAEALSDCEDDADFLRVLRIIQAGGADNLLERVFGRIQVAQLSNERFSMLRSVVENALDFSIEQLPRRDGFFDRIWSDRVSAHTEILSRLVIRSEPDEASRIFMRALDFAKDFRWNSNELFEALGDLLERSFSAIPPAKRNSFLGQIINFPLPDELVMHEHFERNWPESSSWLAESLTSRPLDDEPFAARVSALIEKVRNSKRETRNRAANRLANLYFAGALTTKEEIAFGQALWARRESDKHFPADTMFYSHMFLLLPAPDKELARALFKQRNHEATNAEYLVAIGGAASRRKNGPYKHLFTKEEALEKLDELLTWKPQVDRDNDFGRSKRENEMSRGAIGAILADAILPEIASDDLSTERIENLFSLQESVVSVVQAYPELRRMQPQVEDRIVRGILRAMISTKNSDAWAGFNAIYRWTTMAEQDSLPAVPRRLVESVVSIVETRREPGLLHALSLSSRLIIAKIMNSDDAERLIAALGLILVETSYSTQESSGMRITTLTLVRAAAARLAEKLHKNGYAGRNIDDWLEAASHDPMPEVRFASVEPES